MFPMHVEPEPLKFEVAWDPQPYGSSAPAIWGEAKDLAAQELPDEAIEVQKPGNRGLIFTELQGLLQRCSEGDPLDPRWDELRLRVLDRVAKLLRVYEPQKPGDRAGGSDTRVLAAQVARDWDALEAKARAS